MDVGMDDEQKKEYTYGSFTTTPIGQRRSSYQGRIWVSSTGQTKR